MKDNFEPFDDFFKQYEAFDKATVDDIIQRYSSTDFELKRKSPYKTSKRKSSSL